MENGKRFIVVLAIFSVITHLISNVSSSSSPVRICIIGSGISGSSAAHFLRTYSDDPMSMDIKIFEKQSVVGGRMATVYLSGDVFEAGASIIHPKNFHALNFTSMLHLQSRTSSDDDSWFAIWDGTQFVFKTLPPPKFSIYRKMTALINSLLLFRRYGLSLFKMQRFVQDTVKNFLHFYEDFQSRPVFGSVEGMLKWAGLYELTGRTLKEELAEGGLSPRLISELITVIMRINYGQNVNISGMAGAVSLAGSDPGLWSVEGGNWQIAAGLIDHANASLHLQEEVTSVSYNGGYYELNSTKGRSYHCEATVVATPLDELSISFSPPISITNRKLQHTYTTFVRGLLNPVYFGLNSASEIPDLVGTLEVVDLPFSSISVLKKYSSDDRAYKIFSRRPMEDDLLDLIFRVRTETIKINWAAYPHFEVPEVFSPILLDGSHLYYINAFENAASTIETGAVAAENVARLILSRLPISPLNKPNLINSVSGQKDLHLDL